MAQVRTLPTIDFKKVPSYLSILSYFADASTDQPFTVVGNSSSPVYIFDDPAASDGDPLEELSSHEESNSNVSDSENG